MVVQQKLYTPDDLWKLSHQPGEAKRLELVKGEIREMTPTGALHGVVTMEVGRLIANYVRSHDLGYVTGAETGFILRDDPYTVRAPDVGMIVNARITFPIPEKYFPLAPDLAVEVVSPGDTAQDIREKVIQFLQAGTRLVWVVYPDSKTVDVYRPGKDVQVATIDGALDGGDVLPGLHITLRDVFASVEAKEQ